jgi:hypothetical protein
MTLKAIVLLAVLAMTSWSSVEGACTISFSDKFDNTQALNLANQATTLNTFQACFDACKANANCWSFDFDRDNVCWFGNAKNPTKFAKSGCVHVDKIETCAELPKRSCDNWEKHTDARIVNLVNDRLGYGYTEESCKSACILSGANCFNFDFHAGSGACYVGTQRRPERQSYAGYTHVDRFCTDV